MGCGSHKGRTEGSNPSSKEERNKNGEEKVADKGKGDKIVEKKEEKKKEDKEKESKAKDEKDKDKKGEKEKDKKDEKEKDKKDEKEKDKKDEKEKDKKDDKEKDKKDDKEKDKKDDKEKDKKDEKEKDKKDDKAVKENLAGGHADDFKFKPDGTIWKAGKKRELEFFKNLDDPSNTYAAENAVLKKFMPKFHKIEEDSEKKWIVMDNATFGYNAPAFMDIKLGDASYTPDNSEDKKQKRILKDKKTTTFEFGFRITGMTVKKKSGETDFKMKKEFDNMGIDKVPELLKRFLKCNEEPAINKEAAAHFLGKMKEYLEFLTTKSTRFMIGSSFFFVLSNVDKKWDLKVIDFAHVFPLADKKKDDGVIKGVNKLIELFEAILKEP